MTITLGDGTEITVATDENQVAVKIIPPWSWPWGATGYLTVKECAELMRVLGLNLKQAEDW